MAKYFNIAKRFFKNRAICMRIKTEARTKFESSIQRRIRFPMLSKTYQLYEFIGFLSPLRRGGATFKWKYVFFNLFQQWKYVLWVKYLRWWPRWRPLLLTSKAPAPPPIKYKIYGIIFLRRSKEGKIVSNYCNISKTPGRVSIHTPSPFCHGGGTSEG